MYELLLVAVKMYMNYSFLHLEFISFGSWYWIGRVSSKSGKNFKMCQAGLICCIHSRPTTSCSGPQQIHKKSKQWSLGYNALGS